MLQLCPSSTCPSGWNRSPRLFAAAGGFVFLGHEKARAWRLGSGFWLTLFLTTDYDSFTEPRNSQLRADHRPDRQRIFFACNLPCLGFCREGDGYITPEREKPSGRLLAAF